MKKMLCLALIVVLALPVALMAQSPRGTAEASFSAKSVEINYGRPSLGGRDMLGRLPAGSPWRMGADSATMLKTEATLKFGDETVEPGEYRLWALKTQSGEWQIAISSSDKSYSASNNVALVSCEKGQGDKVETFTIELEGEGSMGSFTMAWDTLRVTARFSAR